MRTDHGARFYELMSISVPDGSPEELIETSQAVSGYIEAVGGRVLRSSNDSPWGRRRLAYPIRHESSDLRDGFYTLYHFELEPQRIQDIEREIKLNERIIRHLLLQLDSEPVFVEEEEEVDASTEAEGAAGDVAESADTAAVVEIVSAPEAAAEVEAAAIAETEPEIAQVETTEAVDDVEAVATDTEPEIVDAAVANEVTGEDDTDVTEEEK